MSTPSLQKPYAAPFTRVLKAEYEYAFLQSNTEPIEGGNDPDIEW